MFLGSFKTDFSGKNRLILPKKFRKELGNSEKFYLFLGQNGEIWGFDEENWQKQAQKVLEIPLSLPEGRRERLSFFSRADECVLDGQGRFILPLEMAGRLDLKGGVIILGAGDHFEIWDPEVWKTYQYAEKI
jgi:MraZ protein